ncbi:MAG: hypothetical protein SNJ63_04575 [Sphingomonadaceae bacterium]
MPQETPRGRAAVIVLSIIATLITFSGTSAAMHFDLRAPQTIRTVSIA